ncbi:virB8 family protein [uncultured Aliivibrio sp.]|uniref:virB8 family protein n=1 Tax=uncultured Aliivibrio sp. TaxID=873085 RepID=UPI002616F454|nr:type IV secretion system protein [uncultured Aliivibrio sp.]
MELIKKEQDTLFKDTDALDFEASKSLMIANSEHRAWSITKGACALTVLSWVALVLLMPLKTEVPYVAMVNEVTGYTQLLTTLSEETISKQDALDAFWVGNYVRNREVYDWYTIQDSYDSTLLMSSPDVGRDYANIFEGDDALDSVWGKRFKAQVRLLSKPIIKNNIATVRFEKTLSSVEESRKGQSTTWIATLGFKYKADAQSDEQRLKNPLGFEVVSYRLDPELME